MKISCVFGHKWSGCKCQRCGATRDEGHVFEVYPDTISFVCYERCTACGKKRQIDHQWDGCMCQRCFAKRDEGHDFRPVPGECVEKCRRCGKTRPIEHQWRGCKCERCGKVQHVYENIPGTGEQRCKHCGALQATYELSAFEAHEKGAIVVALKMIAATMQDGSEARKMADEYWARVERDDRFSREELGNISYAVNKALEIHNKGMQDMILANARARMQGMPADEPMKEMLFSQELKKTAEKLEAFVAKLKE